MRGMTNEEAIDLLDNLVGMVEDNHNSNYDTALRMAIKALEQEPKTGHWKRNETIRLTYCSECGFGQHIDEFRTYYYCPNCGAKMQEVEE